jgi:hypothetical protein
MLKKLKNTVKRALSSKPIAYVKKVSPERSHMPVKAKGKTFKAPNYRGANFIKKK